MPGSGVAAEKDEAEAEEVTPEKIVQEILNKVEVP